MNEIEERSTVATAEPVRAAVAPKPHADRFTASTITDEQLDALYAALRQAADWIVSTGFPYDWQARHNHPPTALWEAIVDAVHADPDGNLHGGDLTREEVDAWLRFETGRPVAVPPSPGRATPSVAPESHTGLRGAPGAPGGPR